MKKSVLVIGLGVFGRHLALKLKEQGNDVCVVDMDEDTVDALRGEFSNMYVADCTKKGALKDLGVSSYDVCVVAIGENFQSSLEITALLKELKAKKVISKATTEIQEKFLKLVGADEIVYPERDIAEKTAIICNQSRVFDYFELGNFLGIYEVQVPKTWVGKSLKALDLRNKYKVNICALKVQGVYFEVPSADYIFNENDHAIVIGNEKYVTKIAK